MESKNNITGIVLTGGKSSRMGIDKGLLLFKDKTFLERSIEALKPLVTEIIIVSDNPKHDVSGIKRVEDLIKNSGPLAGIYSGLKASKTDYNVVLSCDIPLINSNVIKELIIAIDQNSDIILLESNGIRMPLIAIYKKECLNVFLDQLTMGERKLWVAVNKCNTNIIVLDQDKRAFTANINTQEDYKIIKNEYNC